MSDPKREPAQSTAPTYRWHGIPGAGESMSARRAQRRDEADTRQAANIQTCTSCLLRHRVSRDRHTAGAAA